MSNPWKKKVFAYNKEKAKDKETAQDLMTLLGALPPGRKKQLLKDEVCNKILIKYGITEAE